MSYLDQADKLAQWNQKLMIAAGGLALNYWIDKGMVKVVAKRAGPIATGIAIWHVVNWVGLSASAALDPERGATNWSNYIASPLQKISPGKDSILSNVADATMLHFDSDIAHKFARKSPWIKTWMAAYGADVF